MSLWALTADSNGPGHCCPAMALLSTVGRRRRLLAGYDLLLSSVACGEVGLAAYPVSALIASPMSLAAMSRHTTVMMTALCWLIQSFSPASSFSERVPMAK